MESMEIRPIIRMGNPILRLKANAVEPEHADSLTTIIPDMIATMRDAGGVGLAAPQIGISLRLMVFEVPVSRATNLDGDKPCDIQVLINLILNLQLLIKNWVGKDVSQSPVYAERCQDIRK